MNRVKYPRTRNFPWSQSNSSDDCWWKDCRNFDGREVVVTEKLDGECTTVYPDGWVHARSLDTSHHPSRSWMKRHAAEWAHQIPAQYRVCGENLYAWHSIFYTNLPTYFLVFGIYDEENRCLSWSSVEEFCSLLGLFTVPVIYKGMWDETHVRGLWNGVGAFPTFASPDQTEKCKAEGYVVREEGSFPYEEFALHCAKYVREHHVQTDSHWMEKAVVPNLMR